MNTIRLLVVALVISFCSGLIKLILGSSMPLLITDVFLLFFLVSNLKGYDLYLNKVVSLAILFLVGMSFLQLFNSNVINPTKVLSSFRINVFIFIYVFIGFILYYRSFSQIETLRRALWPFLFLNVLLGLLEFLFPSFPLFRELVSWEFGESFINKERTLRITGLLVGSVQFSLITSMVCFHFISKGYFSGYTKKSVCIILLSLLTLFLTKSRAVMFSFVFITLVFFLFNKARNKSKRLKFLLVTVLCFFVASFSYYAMNPKSFNVLYDRYVNAFDMDALEGSSFNKGRVSKWEQRAIPMILARSEGYGTGFSTPSKRGKTESLKNYQVTPIWIDSMYLGIFVELGWVAGLVFIMFSIYSVVLAFRYFILGNTSFYVAMAYCVLIFFMVGLTSPVLAAFPFSYLMAIFLGVLFARSLNKRRKRKGGVSVL